MATTPDVAFKQQFSNAVIILLQQEGSVLRDTVRVEKVNAKAHHFDRIGSLEAQVITSRNADTVIQDVPHSRRRVIMTDYAATAMVDSFDELRMTFDPKGPYVQTIAFALGRAIDNVIITAALGNATAMDESDTASTVALPAAQIIDEDFVTSNSDLIKEKVVEAHRIFMSNRVNMAEDLFLALDSVSYHKLIQETVVASADYANKKPLSDGKLQGFMGFKYVHYEDVPASGEGTGKVSVAYVRSGVGLALGSDVGIEMAPNPNKLFHLQITGKLTCGAVRIEDEKVIKILNHR